MNLLFWLSLLALIYAFIGYPLLVRLAAALWGRKTLRDEHHTPRVSVLLSVYNEEQVIREKIENFLELDYPKESIELLVISDGCSDKTEEIVHSFASNRVRLLVQEERGGKTLALNRGAQEANGEILVFTDANSMYAPDAVRNLVLHFADPSVGLVSGRSVYLDAQSRLEQSGGAYRSYEDFIKNQESLTVSIIGADGAIYALRKELYEPLPSEYINDLIHTVQVVTKGFRAIQETEAICREVLDADTQGELQRQTRIMAQSWLIVLSQAPGLLAAGRLGHFWALLSHKVLRWLTLPLMGTLLTANFWLAPHWGLYQITLLAQIVFFIAVIIGWQRTHGLLRIPAMFTLLHAAAILGLFRLINGQVYATWAPRKN
jgi:cellulose synthase/poly-beta-1,6-N-acetylglucosamine synthase-like glycosyltransferase